MPATVLYDLISSLLIKAGDIAIKVQNDVDYQEKEDRSIITIADLEISKFLKEELSFLPSEENIFFDEEEVDKNKILPLEFFSNSKKYVWFIDPIAGTTCYAAGMPLYAISIGILKEGKPYIGGVYLPSLGELYISDGKKAYFSKIESSKEKACVELRKNNTDKISKKPLFHHANIETIEKYNIISKKSPFVIIPSVNIGLMWTLVGKFRASVIKVKLWDFAGAWVILQAIGLKIINVETEEELLQIDSNQLLDDWTLRDTHIVCDPIIFSEVKRIISKDSVS